MKCDFVTSRKNGVNNDELEFVKDDGLIFPERHVLPCAYHTMGNHIYSKYFVVAVS